MRAIETHGHNINIQTMFITTDGQNFREPDKAKRWQSKLDYDEFLLYDEVLIGNKTFIKIYDKDHLNVLIDYLRYYLGFTLVYSDYSNLTYPISTYYILNDKKFKIKC